MMKNRKTDVNLQKERLKKSFSVEELTNVLDGGANITKRRRAIESLIFEDKDMCGPDLRHMDRNEQFSELIRKDVKVIMKGRDYGLTDEFDLMTLYRTAMTTYATGLTLHTKAFIPMLKMQSSDEQLKTWMPLVDSFQIIGCYAQTELGHGTNVKGIETSADYDPKTEEFILNTPTLEATKWWIGGLGKTANHALLLAQLYTKGECHGVHAFLVQIRDHNHLPLPGVSLGDIGPKMGFAAVDNGFLRLNNLRIPRMNMLMRYSKVLKDGTFIKPENDKLIYGGMLYMRRNLSDDTVFVLCMAVTVAVRYSCVRRQSVLKEGDQELQVLDYQTQQDKLFPYLATAYAFRLAVPTLKKWLDEIRENVFNGDHSDLVEAHAFVSGLKVLATTKTAQGIEVCRLACGGHGYITASNFPMFYKNVVAAVTAEGEVTVLLLQTARFLLKTLMKIQRGQKISGYSSYLASFIQNGRKKFAGQISFDSLVEASEYRSARLLAKCGERFKRSMEKFGMTPEQAWNNCSVDLTKSALAHTECVIARVFSETVKQCSCSNEVRRVLENICRLYLVHNILDNCADLLQGGYFSSSDVYLLRDDLYRLYEVIRPDAVLLVDAFDLQDEHLNSALGSYNGNVYEDLFTWAQQSKLNETEVHSSFYKYLKPARDLMLAKL